MRPLWVLYAINAGVLYICRGIFLCIFTTISGESSVFHSSVLGFFGKNLSHDNNFNIFLNAFFVHFLKMSNFGDQRFMVSSDDSEGTGLINRSRSKLTTVLISSRPIGMAHKPISDKRNANFNHNIGDHPLKFTWLFIVSRVPIVAWYWSMTSIMTPLNIMRVIVSPSELYICPIFIGSFLIKHILWFNYKTMLWNRPAFWASEYS